ncbi:2617_t:CDS:2, partial [Racocetra persica]
QLVESYHHTKQLAECETKEDQRMRNAFTNFIKTRIQLFEPYFPELNSLKMNYKSTSLILSNIPKESSTIDIGIQVTINNDLLIQIDTLKTSLANLVTDHSNQLQIIQAKNNRISELENKCEFLKKQITELNTKLKLLSLYQNQ